MKAIIVQIYHKKQFQGRITILHIGNMKNIKSPKRTKIIPDNMLRMKEENMGENMEGIMGEIMEGIMEGGLKKIMSEIMKKTIEKTMEGIMKKVM